MHCKLPCLESECFSYWNLNPSNIFLFIPTVQHSPKYYACPIQHICSSRYVLLYQILSAWRTALHWLIGHPHVLLMHFHYTYYCREKIKRLREQSPRRPWSQPPVGLGTNEGAQIQARPRFLPFFVVRHSFHCRMYVCLHVILMYVCNALARHNIRTISHEIWSAALMIQTEYISWENVIYYSYLFRFLIIMIGFYLEYFMCFHVGNRYGLTASPWTAHFLVSKPHYTIFKILCCTICMK